MSAVATHLRITGLKVTDEDVDRRTKAIADLAAEYRKAANVDELLAKAGAIAAALGGDGTPPASLGAEVQAALEPYAPSFISEEKPLEVGICSGLAVLSVISSDPSPNQSGWSVADVLAVGLWSALAFQTSLKSPKREALRTEVLAAAHNRTIKAAELARVRRSVPDFGELTVAAFEQMAPNFKAATDNTIETLRRNAALDREELDFLWWAMLEHSRLLKKRLADLEEPVRLVVSGIEAARNLRRLPCDVHRDLVLRSVTADKKLSLNDLIKSLGTARGVLAAHFTDAVITEVPTVFPLLNALIRDEPSLDGASVQRHASEWGCRALLEASICHLSLGDSEL